MGSAGEHYSLGLYIGDKGFLLISKQLPLECKSYNNSRINYDI
jgi:hypothetical protein